MLATSCPSSLRSRRIKPPSLRVSRHRSARPASRLPGQKLAPRVFGKKAAPHARETLLLILILHRENVGAEWGLVLGCVVAPNSGDTPRFDPAPNALLGTVDYYAWRNANTPESYKNGKGPNYLTDFAPKYFNRFTKLDKDWGGVFPGIHKWVTATKLELQLALEDRLMRNPALQNSREELMRAAFRTHPGAYRQGYFGELTYLEKLIVAESLEAGDMMAAGWGTAVLTIIDSSDFFLPSDRDYMFFGPFRL